MKDGLSAGIGMCSALVSALTKIPVRLDEAMTGDHPAREVLLIGGLKEKLLAAHRGGIKTVLIPDENQKDLVEIPDNIKGESADQAGQVDDRRRRTLAFEARQPCRGTLDARPIQQAAVATTESEDKRGDPPGA